MAVTFISPIDVTPGTAGSYQDVDVSANVSGDATGVILRVSNASTSADRAWAVRKNGSTFDYFTDLDVNAQSWDFCGLDASKVFEAKLESITDLTLQLVGYFEQEAVFPTSPVNKTPGTTGSYQSVDISSDTGVDTAVAALFMIGNPNAGNVYIRKTGSTDDLKAPSDNRQPIVVGLDGSETCEAYMPGVDASLWLVGYLTQGVTMATNATDITPGSDTTWTAKTLPAGAAGAFVWARDPNVDGLDWGVRKTGSGLGWNLDTNEGVGFAIVEADGSRQIDTYSELASQLKLYRIGTVDAAAAGGGAPLFANHLMRMMR